MSQFGNDHLNITFTITTIIVNSLIPEVTVAVPMEPYRAEGDFTDQYCGSTNSLSADPGLVGIVASGVNRPVQVPGLLDDLFNGTVGQYSAEARDAINRFTDGYCSGNWSYREAAILGARALAVCLTMVRSGAP